MVEREVDDLRSVGAAGPVRRAQPTDVGPDLDGPRGHLGPGRARLLLDTPWPQIGPRATPRASRAFGGVLRRFTGAVRGFDVAGSGFRALRHHRLLPCAPAQAVAVGRGRCARNID